MPISFTQAALGAEVSVPVIDGEPATLRVPRATQHGAVSQASTGAACPTCAPARRETSSRRHQDRDASNKLSARQQERLLREFAETEDQSVLPESHGFWKKMKDLFGA
jgi:molecular chaperone DnaJ